MAKQNDRQTWTCAPCYAALRTRRPAPDCTSCGRPMALSPIPPPRPRKPTAPKAPKNVARSDEPRRYVCAPNCTCLICQLSVRDDNIGSSVYFTNDARSGCHRTAVKPGSP